MASNDTLRVASKLSDIEESFQWYCVQSPDLAKLDPRVGHALVSLENGKVLIIGGGNHSGAFSDIYILDLEPTDGSEKAKLVSHPASQSFPAKYEFFCGKENKTNSAWLFGGASTSSTSNDVIRIDKDSIVTIPPNDKSPSCRTQGGNCALIELNGKPFIAVFAGGFKGDKPVQDQKLYLFNIEKEFWETYNGPEEKDENGALFEHTPPAVQGHIMAAVGSKIILHGGINSSTLYDGFHSLDLKSLSEGEKTCSWTNHNVVDSTSEKPSARAAHGIARLSDVQVDSTLLYTFGGMGEKGECNDLWRLNTDSMAWTQVTKNKNGGPLPRLDFGMCTVGFPNENGDLDKFILIHGGMSRTGDIYNDAWIMKV